MAFHFATISTHSHLYKTFALIESVLLIEKDVVFHVLITDQAEDLKINHPYSNHVVFYSVAQIPHEKSNQIIKKYRKESDKIRWCFKPVFLDFLLQLAPIQKVIYADNDIAFFNSFHFLFALLDTHSILLTPHYYDFNPNKNQNWLEANFRVGLFNAGFIGASRKAHNSLMWWADCCLYRCEKNPMRGLFDDQKYLDLLPIIDKDCHVLRHQGCNVADWNIEVLKRTPSGKDVLINHQYPIIFIHFNGTSIQNFLEGKDVLLSKYFHQYAALLKKQNPYLDLQKEAYKLGFLALVKLKIWHFLNYWNGTS